MISKSDQPLAHSQSSHIFDWLFGRASANGVILAYGILIFLDGFPSVVRSYGLVINQALAWMAVYFAFEVVYHIRQQGLKGYFSRLLNLLDFTVVMLGLVMVLLPYLTVVNIAVLRLVRLLKLTRMFRFVPRAEEVYLSIGQALRASGAVFLLLAILIFFLSLCGHAFFGKVLPEQFGTPVEAIYTVFTVFSVENWNEVPDAATASGLSIAWAVRAFFIVVLIVGGFLGLSLANAVFVDEMAQDNNKNILNEMDALKEQIAEQNQSIQKLSELNVELLQRLEKSS